MSRLDDGETAVGSWMRVGLSDCRAGDDSIGEDGRHASFGA